MHSSGSILRTIVEQVRTLIDLPTVDARYSDSYMVANLVAPEMAKILSHLHLTNGAPIIFPLPITLVEGQEEYQLPPNVREVLKVTVTDDQGTIVNDPKPGHFYQHGGEKWRVTGPPGCFRLKLGKEFDNEETITVFYVPNGDIVPHLGTGTLATVSSSHVFTLATTPTLGLVDRREGAYAGSVLRILPSAATSRIESRMIQTQTVDTGWKVTPVSNFEHIGSSASNLEYEVVPAAAYAFVDVVAASICVKLGNKLSAGQFQRLQLEYRRALKQVGDLMTNIQTREGAAWRRDTVDNYSNANPYETR